MKVKLNHAWRMHKKGEIVDLPAAYAEAMVRNRQAEIPPAAKPAKAKKPRSTEAPQALL